MGFAQLTNRKELFFKIRRLFYSLNAAHNKLRLPKKPLLLHLINNRIPMVELITSVENYHIKCFHNLFNRIATTLYFLVVSWTYFWEENRIKAFLLHSPASYENNLNSHIRFFRCEGFAHRKGAELVILLNYDTILRRSIF